MEGALKEVGGGCFGGWGVQLLDEYAQTSNREFFVFPLESALFL